VNVLYLVKHFPSLSQTFVLNEVLALMARGCEVHVASAINPHEPIALNPDLASRVFYLRHGSLYRYGAPGDSSPAADAADVLALIERNRIDRIHCDFAEDNVMLAAMLHEATGLPFTFKMRAYDIYAEPLDDLARHAAAASRVFTICEYNRDYICRAWGLARDAVTVVYDGINPDQIMLVAHYKHHPLRIVSVGRLVDKKGVRVLLDACGRLKDRRAFRCEVYGDGPMMPSLQSRIIELGLGSQVTLHGSRPHFEVLAAIRSASVFALACVQAANGDRDATPNVLLEAMATAIPVVSTRMSGIPEIVRDGVDGLLVPPGDAVALADAIERLADDPALSDRIRLSGRHAVITQFTIDRTVDGFLAALPTTGAHAGERT
jgi:colanic acid/amylovoran biosynthesis glycosyltransferase